MKAGHVGHVVSLGTTPDHSPDEKRRASAVLRFDERRYPKKSRFVSNYVDWMTYDETADIGIASADR